MGATTLTSAKSRFSTLSITNRYLRKLAILLRRDKRVSRQKGIVSTGLLCALFFSNPSSADPHAVFGGLLRTVEGARSGEADTGGQKSAQSFYVSEVDPLVQESCLVCHQEGRTADQQGARLLFTDEAPTNHLLLEAFVTTEGIGAEWLLGKIVGDINHGGGAVIAPGSVEYETFAEYLTLLLGANTDGGSASSLAFWDGTEMESRETTLRRAGLLLAGEVPSEAAVSRAVASDDALRTEVKRLMTGVGFHDFLIHGANDQLLTDGLNAGVEFDLDALGRFPAYAAYVAGLPVQGPADFAENEDRPFLTQGLALTELKKIMAREPLELIAQVVMSGQSYKKILTSDYTMVSPFSAIAFRSDADFGPDVGVLEGYFDAPTLYQFLPGQNRGHIPFNEQTVELEDFSNFTEFHDWPHAGLLNTFAFLNRYPSTDTNRNRARARWTYLHFLGVDIEASAPRTMDAAALTDNDNPTMKNPACTVCHERLDPVAGAFQSFGDKGSYLDQFGGMDSLSDAYKSPELYGGELGSTGYEEGDTWYRDMRAPGFEGEIATGEQDSLQWLAQQIVSDPRFATATVRFWWPAVFGADPVVAPTDPNRSNYEGDLLAFNAQDRLVRELADRFAASGYQLKDLLAEMFLSPWYRTHSVPSGLDPAREAAFISVGRGRLLTPEELDRKNRGLFGRTWREGDYDRAANFLPQSSFFNQWGGYAVLYGGIDSAGITDRNRNLGPLMNNVVERMGLEYACQVVLEDFNRPREERRIFTEVEKTTEPLRRRGARFSLTPDADRVGRTPQLYQRSLDFEVENESVTLNIRDMSSTGCVEDKSRTEDDDGGYWCSQLGLDSYQITKNGRVVVAMTAEELVNSDSFQPEIWVDGESEDTFAQGDWYRGTEGVIYFMWGLSGFAIATDLSPGEYTVTLNFASRHDPGHPEPTVVADVGVRAPTYSAESEGAKAFASQLDRLFLTTTASPLSPSTRTALTEAFIAASTRSEVIKDSDSFEGYCGINQLGWDNQYAPYNQMRMHDPLGTLRGWALITHFLMTSYAYLHD